MTDYCVPPPAQGEWYDADVITEAVLSRLRLRTNDLDKDRVLALVPVAAGEINNRLDRVHEMTPETVPQGVLEALRNVTVEMYLRRGPVPAGVISLDDLAGIVDAAAPDFDTAYRSRMGWA